MTSTTSAIFALSGTDPAQLAKHISATYPTAAITPAQPWSLSHTLFRGASGTPSTQPTNSFLHAVQLSTHPKQTFFCTSSDTVPTQSIAIPQGAASADFRRLVHEKLGSLWQPVRQGDVHVANGISWDFGIFRIQTGDLLRDRGVGGGGLEKRGTAVLVSLMSDTDMVELATTGEQPGRKVLEEFCGGLALMGEQKSAQVLAEAWGSVSNWSAEMDLWCEMLKKLALGGPAQRAR